MPVRVVWRERVAWSCVGQSMRHYQALFLSDTHIGHPEAHVNALLAFMEGCTFDELYLLGDIFDEKMREHFVAHYQTEDVALMAAYLAKRAEHTRRCVRIAGNHDPAVPVLDDLLPVTGQPYVLDSRTLLTHGHIEEYLWRAGDFVNGVRKNIGANPVKRPPARTLPLREKTAAFTGVFRRLARLKVMYPEMTTVIHGHLHTPGIRWVDGVQLVCLDDWLDNAGGAVVEYGDGEHLGRRALIDAQHNVLHWLDEPQPAKAAPAPKLAGLTQNIRAKLAM